jgi:hypothetical protein
MRLVMDVLFLEEMLFRVQASTYYRHRNAWSREEVLRALMKEVGIEMIDYGSFTVQPVEPPIPITSVVQYYVAVYSKAYRERVERDAMAGR